MSSHNSIMIPWWIERGVVMTYVMDATLTNPRFEQKNQVRIPGGGEKEGESPLDTAHREFKEETGWVIKKKYRPLLIQRELKVGNHLKTAWLVPREACRGRLRTRPLYEGDAILEPPRPVTFDEAIRTVHRSRSNSFNLLALEKAHEMIKERFGL